MAFTLKKFLELRPYLYHLTAQENRDEILYSRILYPAAKLLAKGNRTQENGIRRVDHLPIEIKGEQTILRDQKPLHKGNVEWEENWDLKRFVKLLNSRVFFWPGDEKGPVASGRNHFKCYAEERPAILRFSTLELINFNKRLAPEFCRYNSGSPRMVLGRKSPRGRATFRTAKEIACTPGQVVEVTFPGTVQLPFQFLYRKAGKDWSVDCGSCIVNFDPEPKAG